MVARRGYRVRDRHECPAALRDSRDDPDPPEEQSRPDLRVRLPRGEYRDGRHPQGRPRRRAKTTEGTLMKALVVFGLALGLGSSSGAEVTVVKAGRLIDGRGGEPLEPAVVIVEGGRIREVGRTLSIPPGPLAIDLGDATLLPGLIDLHTHMVDRADVHWEEGLLKTTPPDAALPGARNALVTLMAGFTTSRGMG